MRRGRSCVELWHAAAPVPRSAAAFARPPLGTSGRTLIVYRHSDFCVKIFGHEDRSKEPTKPFSFTFSIAFP